MKYYMAEANYYNFSNIRANESKLLTSAFNGVTVDVMEKVEELKSMMEMKYLVQVMWMNDQTLFFAFQFDMVVTVVAFIFRFRGTFTELARFTINTATL